MAQVIERAVADRERPLAQRRHRSCSTACAAHVAARDTARIVEGAQRRRGTHNEQRPLRRAALHRPAGRALQDTRRSASYQRPRPTTRRDTDNVTSIFDRDATLDATVAGALARGEAPPEGGSRSCASRLRRRPEVRTRSSACGRCSPAPSSSTTCSGSARSCARRRAACSPRTSRRSLHRRRGPDVARSPWTEADVALVDEADALLGPVEAARPPAPAPRRADDDALDTASPRDRRARPARLHRRRDARAAATASRPTQRRASRSREPRTFGHVLVDEAQDLTAMQWRMLARRCPSGSMTLVGDFGQASRPGARRVVGRRARAPAHAQRRRGSSRSRSTTARRPRSWRSRPGCSRSRRRRSSRRARCAAPASSRASSRRSRGDLVATRARHARAALARTGTVAVIAPTALHAAIIAALADVGAVARRGRRARRAGRGARRRPTRRASSSTTWSWSNRPQLVTADRGRPAPALRDDHPDDEDARRRARRAAARRPRPRTRRTPDERQRRRPARCCMYSSASFVARTPTNRRGSLPAGACRRPSAG